MRARGTVTLRTRAPSLVLALLGAIGAPACSSHSGGPADARGDVVERDAALDSRAPSDASGLDAGLVDGARDAADDAPGDASLDAALACPMDPYPLPSSPPCFPDEAVCFRACADRVCFWDCLALMLTSDCWDCVFTADLNCSIERCPAEVSAWSCCRESRCPPSGACSACDPELDALRMCEDAAFLPHCRAALEACFP